MSDTAALEISVLEPNSSGVTSPTQIKLELPTGHDQQSVYPSPALNSNPTDADANKREDLHLPIPANEKPDVQSETSSDNLSFYLRNIKRIALALIASCICVGAVMSKVSLVSITDRMNPRFNLGFNLTGFADEYPPPHRSVLFIQLILLLVIPEVVSFVRCLVWGVIGKTTRSFPWPSRCAFFWVSRSTQYSISCCS